MKLSRILLLVLVGLLAVWAGDEARADYTWTNTATGASGFWTNGNLWATPANYPGSNAATDKAYLTNNTTAGATYTNILNFNLPNSLNTLVISNGAGGYAWLIVTNNAASTGVGLTNATFILGNGGGLQIDSGGLVSNTTTFTWTGTNGVINLNNNGTLIARGTFGNTSSGITGLVTSTSSAGGVWDLNGSQLLIGGAATSNNLLTVNNVTLTNAINVSFYNEILGSNNSFTMTNGAKFFSINGGAAVTVGGDNYSSNDTFSVLSGSTFVGGSGGYIGVNWPGLATSGFNNQIVVSGGSLSNNGACTFSGYSSGMTVTNGTVWMGRLTMSGGSNVFVNVLTNGTFNLLGGALYIGQNAASTDDVVNINGGILTNAGNIQVGNHDGSINSRLILTNGGKVFTTSTPNVGVVAGAAGTLTISDTSLLSVPGLTLGFAAGSTGVVIQTGGTVTIGGVLQIGAIANASALYNISGGTLMAQGIGVAGGSGGVQGGWGTLTISGTAFITNSGAGAYIGGNGGSVGQTGTVNQSGGTWNNGGQAIYVGYWRGAGPVPVGTYNLTGGVLTNLSNLQIGHSGGLGTMTISGSAYLGLSGAAFTMGGNSSGTGFVFQTGGTVDGGVGLSPLNVGVGLANDQGTYVLSGGTMTNMGAVTIAAIGSSLTISNGGNFFGGAVSVANIAGDSNDSYTVGGLGTISTVSNGAITVGAIAGAGGNKMSVTNANLMNSGGMTIGTGSSNNTVTVYTNGTWTALAKSGYSFVIGTSAATGNVLVVNGGTVTNVAGGNVEIGNSSTSFGNSLVISNGGQWAGGAILIGNTAGASNNTYQVGGLGLASTASNGNLTISQGGAMFNTLTVSNATLFGGVSVQIGLNTSNNTLSILSNGTVTLLPSSVTAIGYGTATGNVLTVNGGTLNAANIYVGQNGANGNSFTVTNGTVNFSLSGANTPSLEVGGQGGVSSSNTVLVLGGSTWTGAGTGTTALVDNYLQIGAANASAYNQMTINKSVVTNFTMVQILGSNNSLTLTNAAKLYLVPLNAGGPLNNIGSSDISSNNTLSILAGSFFSDLSARPVWILGYSNQLVVNGGTYTNANSGSALSGGVLIGGTGSGVTVTNGLFSSFGVAVGIYNSIQFGTNDFFNVLGGGTANLNNASLNVGGSGGGSNSVTVNGGILTNVALVTVGATGSGFNTMTVTNAKVWTTDLTIGSGASNNAVNVQANAVWNLLGNTVTIGTGAATGNVLTVSSGGVLTNASTVTISSSNVLNLQGGSLFSTAVTNLAGGVITNFGALAGLVYNQGTVAVNGGTLAFLGGLTNQGVLTVLTGGMASFTNAAGSYVFTNYSGGTVNLQGGTIRDKDFVNQGQFNTTGGLISNALINDLGAFMYVSSGVTTATPDLTNYGVITNASTLQVGLTGAGPVVNTNLFVMQGGTLIAGSITNTSSGTFQLAATGTNTLRTTTFVNNGTISMANGQTLTFGGGTTLAITGTGVVTTPGGPVNLNIPASATLSFQNSGASAIQIGALTLPTGSVLEQKNGTGNTYTWSGSFDGANALGSFVLSSGTFQLGNSINMNLGQDFIIAGAATIDLNGFNLTNAVGRAITNKNVAATITSTSAGGGTLVNNGNLWGGSALTITNVTIDTFGTNNITGTWTLQGGSPGILLLRSDSLLRARATATITGAGQITNTGPANLEVDGGNLTISTTGGISFNVKSLVISNGATLTFSTPGALIGSTIGWQGSMTATGNITFAGGASHGEPWTFLRLDGDVDESLGQGLTFSPVQNNGQGGILFNGHNLTNETGSTVSFVAGATRVAYLSSPTPASFVNKGNLILTPGSITLSITNVTVDNVGTLNFGGSTAYANGLNLQGGANTILLLRSNSTVRATTTASITGGKIQSDTNALTGAPLPVNLEVDAGTFSIIPATGNNPSLNVQSLIIANGATLNFAGNGDGVSMNIGWRGSMTAAGNLTIGNAVIFSGAGCYLSLEGDVDEQLGQGLVFNPPQNGNGGILFNGHSLTNEAGSVVSIANGGGRRDAVFSSAGSPGFLVNYGSLTMTVGSALFSLTVTNVTVANSGTWNLSVPTVTLLSGGVLSNAVTGTLLNAGGTPRITGSSSGAFRNLGTVSVGSGTLTIDTVDSSQWGVGGWLRAGTWLVGGTGTLNLKPLDTTAISVISTNATVIYAGGGTIQVGGGTYVSLTNSLNAIAGTLFLSNSTFNSGTALFAITNGTLQLNAGTLTTRSILLTNTGTIFGSGGVSGFSKLINNGTIRATNGVLTIAGLITGTGASFADTGGTLPLTNANSYTGMTVIDGGQLVVGDPNAVQNSMVSNTTAANGIIFSNVNNANFGGLAGTGDFGLTNGAAGVALSVSNAVNSTYSGALSGSGSLTKGGAGTLVLAGNNTYSGGTTISNGALQAANNTALGSGLVTNLAGGEIQFANNVTVGNTLMLFGTGVANDGALRNISGNNSYTGAVTLGSAARINSDAGQLTVSNIVNSGFDLTVGGASTTLVVGVIGNGSGGLVKDGTGVLAVTAVQTYQGSTVLSNGTLQLGGGNNTLYTNSAITVISGTLDLGGYTQSNNNSVTLLSGLLTNGTVVMTGVSLQGQSGTISATLAGSAGLTKTGSNTLTLAGADTYLGATLVSNGTLAVNGSLYAVGVVNVTSNATLTGSASLGSVAISGGGTISPGNNGVGTITAAALNLAANSKIALDFSTGARSYDQILVTNLNGLIVNGGVLSLYQANTNTPFDLLGNYKLIQYNGTPLPSTDTNLFAVANKTQNRIYGFSVSGGWVTLSISSTGGLGWVGSAIDNYWNTSANWAGGSVPQPGDQLIFDGHTGLNNTNNLTAHTQFSGIYFNSSAGAFTLNGTAVDLLNDVINVSANPQTINLPLVLAASNLVFNTANGNVSVNGAISETNSSFTLTKDGAATLYLAGANTYSGGTILDAGTLSVSAISDSDASGISTSGVLTFHGGALQFTGAGTGSTLRGITNIGIAYIDVTNSAAQLTLGGVISGPNGLMKLGAGSLVLSGTNTYAGGTTISSGTVAIGADNNLGVSGALTLSGGTLETTNTFTLDSTRNLTLNSPGGTFNVDTNSTLTIGEQRRQRLSRGHVHQWRDPGARVGRRHQRESGRLEHWTGYDHGRRAIAVGRGRRPELRHRQRPRAQHGHDLRRGRCPESDRLTHGRQRGRHALRAGRYE